MMIQTNIVSGQGIEVIINQKGNYDIKINKEGQKQQRYEDIKKLLQLRDRNMPQLIDKYVQTEFKIND